MTEWINRFHRHQPPLIMVCPSENSKELGQFVKKGGDIVLWNKNGNCNRC